MKYVDYYPSGLSYKTHMVVRYSTTVWCSSQSVPRVNAEGKKLPTSEWLHHISIVVCSWWELCTAAYTAFLCSCVVSWETLSGLSLLSVGYPQHFSIHMTVWCNHHHFKGQYLCKQLITVHARNDTSSAFTPNENSALQHMQHSVEAAQHLGNHFLVCEYLHTRDFPLSVEILSQQSV